MKVTDFKMTSGQRPWISPVKIYQNSNRSFVSQKFSFFSIYVQKMLPSWVKFKMKADHVLRYLYNSVKEFERKINLYSSDLTDLFFITEQVGVFLL